MLTKVFVESFNHFWVVKVKFNGNDEWVLDRALLTEKEALAAAEKWRKKWDKRLT